MKTSRYLYIFLATNLIFWVFGVCMISYMVWQIVEKPLVGVKVLAVSYIFLSIGIMTFTVGFVGCCGGSRISMFFLKVYVGVMAIFFLLEFCVIIYIGGFTSVELLSEQQFIEYWMDLPITTRTDIQTEYSCCGVTGFDDYLTSGTSPDIGCYTTDVQSSGVVFYTAHQDGCSPFVYEPLKTSVIVNGSWILVLLTVQVLGLFTDVKLIKRIKRQRDRVANDRKAREEKREKARRRRLRLKEDQQSLIGGGASLGDLSSRGDEDERAESPNDPLPSTSQLVVHSHSPSGLNDNLAQVESPSSLVEEKGPNDSLSDDVHVKEAEDKGGEEEPPAAATPRDFISVKSDGFEIEPEDDRKSDEPVRPDSDAGLLSPSSRLDNSRTETPSPTPSNAKV